MDQCCNTKNPLLRNGTSQRERIAKALLPENTRIDSREVEDLITFAYEYSESIRYFNNEDNAAGNWQCFFDFDIGFFLAIITSENVEGWEREYRLLEMKLRQEREAFRDNPSGLNPDPANFRCLINYIYNRAKNILDFCQRTPQKPSA